MKAVMNAVTNTVKSASLIVSLLIGFSLSISVSSAGTLRYFQKSKLHKHTSIHLPSFDELSRYSPTARAKYLRGFQALILNLDSRRSSRTTTIDEVWKKLIETAWADDNTNVNFCVNQGVVLALDPKDPICATQNPQMHQFDPAAAMQPYKMGAALTCAGGGEPCSPIFGFTAQGIVNCTPAGSNSTAACQAAGKGNGEITLGTVVQQCALSKPTAPVNIDCAGLKKFFNTQTAVAEAQCTADGPTCHDIVLSQLTNQVPKDIEAGASTLSTQDAQTLVNYLQTAQEGTQNLGQRNPDCPSKPQDSAPAVNTPSNSTGGTAVAPASVTPPSNSLASPSARSATQAPAAAAPPAPAVQAAGAPCAFPANQPQSLQSFMGADGCVAYTLPNHSVVTLQLDKNNDLNGLTIQQPAVKGVAPAPIAVSETDLDAMSVISGEIQTNLKVAPQQLFNAYLPATPVTSNGAPIVANNSSSANLVVDSANTPAAVRSWVTADGTAISYSVGADPATKSPYLYTSIQQSGQPANTMAINLTPETSPAAGQ